MSNQEPDGWATLSPEGEYVGNDDEIHLDRVRPISIEPKDGYVWKPVMLISPQELTRLRAIEEWAREVESLFLRCLNEYDTAPAYDFWLKKFQAITAPVEGKP